jgi:hypothetical protein
MNANGYSLLHDGEMTYEELLQIEEQIGSIPKGLSEAAIAQLPTQLYRIEGTQEMYVYVELVAASVLKRSGRGRRSLL